MSAALLVGAALGLLGGCPSEQGSPHRCSCSFLTDFDDASKVEVLVCSPSLERAEAIGRGCAQSGAPAPVDACVCRAEESESESEKSCRAGECRALSR